MAGVMSMPMTRPVGTHATGGEEGVDPAAAADVQHDLAGPERCQRRRDCRSPARWPRPRRARPRVGRRCSPCSRERPPGRGPPRSRSSRWPAPRTRWARNSLRRELRPRQWIHSVRNSLPHPSPRPRDGLIRRAPARSNCCRTSTAPARDRTVAGLHHLARAGHPFAAGRHEDVDLRRVIRRRSARLAQHWLVQSTSTLTRSTSRSQALIWPRSKPSHSSAISARIHSWLWRVHVGDRPAGRRASTRAPSPAAPRPDRGSGAGTCWRRPRPRWRRAAAGCGRRSSGRPHCRKTGQIAARHVQHRGRAVQDVDTADQRRQPGRHEAGPAADVGHRHLRAQIGVGDGRLAHVLLKVAGAQGVPLTGHPVEIGADAAVMFIFLSFVPGSTGFRPAHNNPAASPRSGP